MWVSMQEISKLVDWSNVKWLLVVYIVLVVIVYPINKLTMPYLTTKLVDALQNVYRPNGRSTHTTAASTLITYIMIALVVMYGMFATLYYVTLRLKHLLNVDVRRKFIEDILTNNGNLKEQLPSGKWITHFETMPSVVEFAFEVGLSYLLPEIVGLLVVSAYFMYVDVWLGVASLAFLTVEIGYFVSFVGGSQKLARSEYQYNTDFNQRSVNILDNLPYVESSRSYQFERARLAKDADGFFDHKERFARRNAVFLGGMTLPLLLYGMFVICRIYSLFMHKTSTAAERVLYSSVLVVLLVELQDIEDAKYSIVTVANFIHKTSACFDDMRAAWGETATDAATDAAIDATSNEPHANQHANGDDGALVLHDVTLSIQASSSPPSQAEAEAGAPPGTPVLLLKNITWAFAPERMHAVVGPSGSGKTTLCKFLCGLESSARTQCVHGRVLIHGEDVTSEPSRRRDLVAYIPQKVHLFEGTLLQNIRYVCTHVTKAHIHRILDGFDVVSILDKRPSHVRAERPYDYLDKHVGSDGGRISGGQQQIVLVMRTYVDCVFRTDVTPRRCMIFDEPTASMDNGLVEKIHKVLRMISTRMTVVVITHDTALAQKCDTQLKIGGQP